MVIPANLLQALAQPGGGQLCVVIGAGCSIEPPTKMPLSGPLAVATCRLLIADGVIAEGECADPSNLAELAHLVFNKTHGQTELVSRFPVREMRAARPNLGYKHLVALMIERAVTHVLTLNFDRAVENAAVHLGQALTVVTEHGGHVPATPTLVYLHGSADSAPDAWVLRTETMTEGWKGQWEQVIANQILSAPCVLFAGLGSAAPVLSTAIEMIKDAMGNEKQIYQADFGPLATNLFAQHLGITADRYIQGGWCEVLTEMSDRLVTEQVHALVHNGTENLVENGFAPAEQEYFSAHAAKLAGVSLLTLGRLRAYASLDGSVYRPHSPMDDVRIAEPLTRLGQLAGELGLDAQPSAGGTWQLYRNGRAIAQILLASAGGVLRLAAVEPRVRNLCDQLKEDSHIPDVVLVGGLSPSAEITPPVDIIAERDGDNVIDGPLEAQIVSANDPGFIARVGALLNVA